jgi:hypothetical protein
MGGETLMGTSMYFFQIAAGQTGLDGDSLMGLLTEHEDRDEAAEAYRLTTIDTAWEWLDVLLAGSGGGPAAARLPVVGGRLAECEGDAPAMVLDADEVAQAADFLAAASFDELLAGHRQEVETAFGGTLEDWAVADLRLYFDDLRAFYASAKDEGAAVMKWAAF